MRKSATAITAGVAAAAVLLPATVSAQGPASPPNIVDIVIDVSGPTGFDTDNHDYDLLREALVATELAGAVATTDDITVFAPTDQAFIRLARDLGYHGRDEAGAFAFLAEATGFTSAADPGDLADVLLYHVAPGAKTVRELRMTRPVQTLLEGATVEVFGNTVVDADTDDRDAKIRQPRNLRAANGIIQTVTEVLRPDDLDPVVAPTQNIVEIVLAVSGTEGFDDDDRDYDLLRDALVATELAGAVATLDDITVFAPRDQAFIRLARDLGFQGRDEEGAFAFLAEATGFVSAAEPGILADVLLYHVAPGAKTLRELRQAGAVSTQLGADATVQVFGNQVVDADTDAVDPSIRKPRDLVATNGIIHTLNRVLRPVDLP